MKLLISSKNICHKSILNWIQVEKLDPDTGLWIPCGRSPDVTMEVKGLTPQKKYKFRVCAVNEEGESIPLEGDEEIIAKDPFGESGIEFVLDIKY